MVPAKADEYPSRPVKVIVPFGAGGPTDVYARAIAEELRKSLHQTFIMENRQGAGTTIGTEVVSKWRRRWLTLLMVSGTQTVNETLYGHKQYQLMRDLVPVAPLIDSDLVLVVHPSVPAKNLAELARARQSEARHAQFRLVRSGLELPHGRRTAETSHRHRHRARALQGFRPACALIS